MLHTARLQQITRLSTLGSIGVVLVALARWGGTARPGPLFVLGVGVFTLIVVGFISLIVWLYQGGLGEQLHPRPVTLQYTVAVLSFSSCTVFTIGFFWDEVWHRRLGGFGDDFFWLPHLLIYTSFGFFALFALSSLVMTLRNQGSVRDRFRSEAHIGLLGLVSAFLMISAPSDALWHQIYGRDITSWSLPHMTLALGVVCLCLIAASLALSLRPNSTWQGLSQLAPIEWVAIGAIVVANVVLLQFGTSEWEGIRSLVPEPDIFRQAFWQRPIWLYPVIVLSIASFVSVFTLVSFKRAGAATLVALGVLLFRVSCLALLGAEAMQFRIGWTGHLLMLIPAVTLDLWVFVWKERGITSVLLVAGMSAVTTVFSVVGLTIIDHSLIYPPMTSHTIPPMVLMGWIMSLVMAALAVQMSRWLSALDPRPVVEASPRGVLYIVAGLVATTGFVSYMMVFRV